ncbi:MAG: hypothetical protein QOH36_1123 [Actinomycetota bacterium]|nr:hypothetical protein [Actinomycetota bacterium]
MRSLRRPAAVFIAIALTGGLAACGDDKKDEATTASTTATTAKANGADAVDVTMKEYAYTIGGDLKPGGTIRLSNQGTQFHMIGLAKLKEGKTIADVTALLAQFAEGPPDEPTTTEPAAGATTTTEAGGPTTTAAGAAEEEDPFAEIADEIGAPGTFMGPGQKADITVPDLAEGTYAMICFLPVEGDAEGTPHFAKGMVGQLTVAGDKAAEPTADATFKVELGKAVTGPSTLTAGKHVIKFEKVGDSDEAEPGLAKLDPGKTPDDINRAFEAFEQGDNFVLPVNAAATLPGQLVAGVFDFYDTDSVYLGVTLTAGTYGIDAHDSDPEDVPPISVEQATFTVT